MTRMRNALRMTLALKFGGIWVCALTMSPSSGWGSEITFKIVRVPDHPMAGNTLVNAGEVNSSGDKVWHHLVDVPNEGVKKITKDCALGTFFIVTVKNTRYTLVDEAEKGCEPGRGNSEIAFEFRPKKYALALDRAITGKALPSRVSAQTQDWQSQLSEAIKTGDFEAALKRSAQIADYLRKTGHSKGAISYRP